MSKECVLAAQKASGIEGCVIKSTAKSSGKVVLPSIWHLWGHIWNAAVWRCDSFPSSLTRCFRQRTSLPFPPPPNPKGRSRVWQGGQAQTCLKGSWPHGMPQDRHKREVWKEPVLSCFFLPYRNTPWGEYLSPKLWDASFHLLSFSSECHWLLPLRTEWCLPQCW